MCILADADSDGAHIATLLCALFLRHFRALVLDDRVHVAMPPLYRIDVGKDVFYALDDDEKKGVLDRIAAEKRKGKINVQRFKGLGEMNPLQLRETTIAPETRRLVRLTVTPRRRDRRDRRHAAREEACGRSPRLAGARREPRRPLIPGIIEAPSPLQSSRFLREALPDPRSVVPPIPRRSEAAPRRISERPGRGLHPDDSPAR